MRIHILLVVAMSLLFVADMQSQKYDRYDNYDFSDGLTSNFVDCIFEDSRGFLWVGTWDGLNRFDGHSFAQYKSDYTDSTFSLPGNWVFDVIEDRQHNLWICTNNGLCRYDYDNDNFHIIRSLYGFDTRCVVQDKDDNVWISSIKGLYKYDYKRDSMLEHYHSSSTTNYLPSNELNKIILDKNQNLWIATINDGLVNLNTRTKHIVNYSLQKGPALMPSNKMQTLTFDTEGRLWVGSFDKGIAILDTATKRITYRQYDKNTRGALGSNGVSSMLCDRRGTMWVCCQNGYLNRYDQETGSFVRYQHNSFTNTSLKTKSIGCIYEDRLGNYWIGTHGNGLACMNRVKNQFKAFTIMPNLPMSLPDNKISSFLEMQDGKIVVGTDGGGFCVFDKKAETFETYGVKHGLKSEAVTSIRRGKGQQVWVATWNGGIALFDYKTRDIRTFAHDNKNPQSLVYDNVKDLFLDNDTLWIATHGEGIAMYDINRNRFTSYMNKGGITFDMKKPTWSNSIIKDSKSRFWISTSAFLYCFDGKQLKEYKMDLNNQSSLSGNLIYSVYEDSKHTIWVLNEGGIDTFNEANGAFERYSTTNLLPKSCRAIVEDNSHNLWISTGLELVCYNPDTRRIIRFTHDDGLPENDFMQRSAYKLKDGTLLFGGTNGFLMFHPDSLFFSTNKPSVEFTNLYIDYRKQHSSVNGGVLGKAFQNTDSITMKYSTSVVSLEIAGIDLSNPLSLSYRYKIDGLTPKWIDLGKERKITLPTLSPGTYRLIVMAYKSNGITSDEKVLVLVVMPVWWQTWWFRLLIVVIGIGITIVVFYYRLRRVNARNKQLEKLVEERTTELVVANTELRELNSTKNKLFTIIAHDLKNPINILIGFSSLLKQNFATMPDAKKLNYIEHIADASKNIFHQLEQLLNWAMAQSNSLHHFPKDTDISTIANEVITLVAEMAKTKEISVSASINLSHMAYVDEGMMSTVIRNITTNAIKFTPRGGRVVIGASEANGMIEMTIADNGVGMSSEQCVKLFKASERVSTYGTDKEKGTGLGLVICKEFVEKNGGRIRVTSELGTGTCFTVVMPQGSALVDNQPNEESSWASRDTMSSPVMHANPEHYNDTTQDKPLVLIVEDTVTMAGLIKESLQDNYDLVFASNGRVGLEKCRELLPDLVVSDVSMPEMDGEQLCLAIKKDPLTNYIPLILLTARNQPNQQLDGLKKGADDYMFKPFEASILQEKINSILKNRELFREHIRRQIICEPQEKLPASKDDEFLEAVVKLIEANISEPTLSVEFIAKEMNLSRAQLFRKFKAIIGQAPMEFIRSIKLRRAAQMLKTGSWRVSDVAYAVGFTDPHYFSNCFSKEYGTSPSLYAKTSGGT